MVNCCAGLTMPSKVQRESSVASTLSDIDPALSAGGGGAQRQASTVEFAGVLAYSFAVCTENVIVFPSLWPRLLDKSMRGGREPAEMHEYLGLAMAAFSFGRAISAPLVNLKEHSKQSLRLVGSICFFLSVAGCLLYVVAETPWTLVASRFMAGLGAGALSLMMTSLVAMSSGKQRTRALSYFYVAASVGEVLGPGIAAATADTSFTVASVTVNGLNNVGLWAAILFVLSFILVFNAFSVGPVDAPETTPLSCKLIRAPMAFSLVALLLTNAAVASWETVVVPMGVHHFGWDLQQNGFVFIASGCVLLIVNLFLVPGLEKLGLTDRGGVFISVACSSIGAVLMAERDLGVAGFITSNVLFTFGIFAMLTYCSSLYTQHIGKRRGFFVGAMRSMSALARVGGNLLAAATLHCYADGSTTTEALCPAFYLLYFPVGIFLVMIVYVCVRLRAERQHAARKRRARKRSRKSRSTRDTSSEHSKGGRDSNVDRTSAVRPLTADYAEQAAHDGFDRRLSAEDGDVALLNGATAALLDGAEEHVPMEWSEQSSATPRSSRMSSGALIAPAPPIMVSASDRGLMYGTGRSGAAYDTDRARLLSAAFQSTPAGTQEDSWDRTDPHRFSM